MLFQTNSEMEWGFKEITLEITSSLDKQRGPRNEGSGLEGTLLYAVDNLTEK